MAEPALTIMDQDCSAYVITWGKLPAVRKLKLSDSSLFASTYSITLDNTTGVFTPGGVGSLFPKVGWAGTAVSLDRNGKNLYAGLIFDLVADDEADTVILDLTTSMRKAADTNADLTGTGFNPAIACLGLLESAGLGDLLSRASFSVAAGYLDGHLIDITCPASEGQTALSLASIIADICSLDFLLVNGLVYCTVQKPWDGSGLRQTIDGNNSHSFEKLGTDSSSFANQVKFSWGASGAVLSVNDLASQKAEHNTIVDTAVDATTAGKVAVTSERTARFYAGLLLSRVSPRRQLFSGVLGEDFTEVLPTWRFPVDYAGLALSMAPFEVNEAQQDLDSDEFSVTLQSLEIN